MKEKVLVSVPKSIFDQYMSNSRDLLEREGFEIIQHQSDSLMSVEGIKAIGSDIVGAVIGCEEWSREVFEACPRLQVLARLGIGVDHIDLEAAKAHSVKVVNAKGMNSATVAEMTILLALSASRNFVRLDRSTRDGKWVHNFGTSLYDKVYGLVGFGNIAQHVAKMLQGFQLKKIIAFDLYPNYEAAQRLGVEFVDLHTLLQQSDIVSLHIPSTAQTHHLINAETLKEMKKSAILINVARGAIVDEKALHRALENKEIRAAGVDVYEQEPPEKSNPLFSLENIDFSPHQAADTLETLDSISLYAASVVVDVVKHQKIPENWVNP